MQVKPQVALPCVKYYFKLKCNSHLRIKIRDFFFNLFNSHIIFMTFQQKQTASLKIRFPGERKIEMLATGMN